MIAGLLAAAALVALPTVYLRSAQREKQRRGELFADALTLFDSYRVTQEGAHFPVLEGRYRGFRVKLEPVCDDIGVRKVPSLWLKATLLVPDPSRGVLDFLVRPQGIEVYSPSHDLERRLPIPADWPQHAILCTDAASQTPDLGRLTPHISIFDDPRTKELLVTPRGIRLVYQAAQANRGDYLVLRQAKFAQTRIDHSLVKTLLDRTIAIATDLHGALEEPQTKVA